MAVFVSDLVVDTLASLAYALHEVIYILNKKL